MPLKVEPMTITNEPRNIHSEKLEFYSVVGFHLKMRITGLDHVCPNRLDQKLIKLLIRLHVVLLSLSR
jgi:hypothetical protein